jgi:hypothetical protein
MDPFEQVTHDMRDFAVEVKRLGYSTPNGYENRFVELSERMVNASTTSGRLKVAAPVSKTNATAVGFAVNGSACHQ